MLAMSCCRWAAKALMQSDMSPLFLWQQNTSKFWQCFWHVQWSKGSNTNTFYVLAECKQGISWHLLSLPTCVEQLVNLKKYLHRSWRKALLHSKSCLVIVDVELQVGDVQSASSSFAWAAAKQHAQPDWPEGLERACWSGVSRQRHNCKSAWFMHAMSSTCWSQHCWHCLAHSHQHNRLNSCTCSFAQHGLQCGVSDFLLQVFDVKGRYELPITFSIMPVSVLLLVVLYICMRHNSTAHVSTAMRQV